MNCLNCDIPLIVRQRINKEVTGVAYTYYHCQNCFKDFDEQNYEISKHGDMPLLKKDDVKRKPF